MKCASSVCKILFVSHQTTSNLICKPPWLSYVEMSRLGKGLVGLIPVSKKLRFFQRYVSVQIRDLLSVLFYTRFLSISIWADKPNQTIKKNICSIASCRCHNKRSFN